MQVYLKPFHIDIKLAKEYSIADFLEFLKTAPIQKEIVRKNRILFVQDMNDDYLVGFMLSQKDFTAHCQYIMENGKCKLTLSEIQKGIEYNFFILHKKSLKGTYLTYSSAATIKTLEQILKHGLSLWLQQLGTNVNNSTWKKNNILCSYILSQETIDTVLSKLKSIHAITFVTIDNQQRIFCPDYLKKTTYKLQFAKEKMGSIAKIREDISQFVKSNVATGISVQGKNMSNEPDVINFDCLTKSWKSYDYDNTTKDIVNIDTDNISAHKIPQQMLSVIIDNQQYKTIIEKQ